MNKVYTAWLILLLLIGIGMIERSTAVDAAESMITVVSDAQAAADDRSDNTAELCRTAAEVWEKEKPKLQIFYPHPDLESTDSALHSAEVFARYEDYVNASVMLSNVRDKMAELEDCESLSYTNLF